MGVSSGSFAVMYSNCLDNKTSVMRYIIQFLTQALIGGILFVGTATLFAVAFVEIFKH